MSATTSRDHVVASENIQGTLVVSLDQPEVLNAFGDEMLEELGEAFRSAEVDSAIQAVVLTGRGRAFCAGANLKATWNRHSSIMSLRKRLSPVILTMAAVEKPVICAVNGVTAGAGLGLLGVCDVRIASDQATFVPATINLGIAPDGGMSYFLPRLIGRSRAFQWLSTGDHLDAASALSWGLVDELAAAEQVVPRALEVADSFKKSSALSVSLTKRLLEASDHNTLAEQLELEHRIQDLTKHAAEPTGASASSFGHHAPQPVESDERNRRP